MWTQGSQDRTRQDGAGCGHRAMAVTVAIQWTPQMGKGFFKPWCSGGCSLVSQ